MADRSLRSAALALVGCLGLAACTPPAAPAPQVTTIVVEKAADPTPTPSTPSATWASTFDTWSGGVARIASTSCDGTGSGSGFLVADDTVVTALHVVDGATALSLRFGSDVVAGQTVGIDAEADLAVVRLATPVDHLAFDLAGEGASVGTRVAALGYPFGEPLGMTQGSVTSTDLRVSVEGVDRWGLFRTDAAIKPGNSGGPVIAIDGTVVGVVDAGSYAPGDGYAVGLQAVRALLDGWRSNTLEAPDRPLCDSAWDVLTADAVVATVTSSHPDAPSIAQTLQLYAESINTGYMDQVWELLTPRMHDRVGGIEAYTEGLSTSAWHWLDVEDVSVVDDTTDEATVSFRTTQAAEYGPNGAPCSDWRATYTLVLDEGSWQIDGVVLTNGEPPVACPEATEPGD